MDLRDLGFVGCRLLALYFGIQALQLVPAVFEALALQLTPAANEGPNIWMLSLSQAIGFAIWAGVGVVLWTNAQTIANLITPPGRAPLTSLRHCWSLDPRPSGGRPRCNSLHSVCTQEPGLGSSASGGSNGPWCCRGGQNRDGFIPRLQLLGPRGSYQAVSGERWAV